MFVSKWWVKVRFSAFSKISHNLVVGDDFNRGMLLNISLGTLSLSDYSAVGDGSHLKYYSYNIHGHTLSYLCWPVIIELLHIT